MCYFFQTHPPTPVVLHVHVLQTNLVFSLNYKYGRWLFHMYYMYVLCVYLQSYKLSIGIAIIIFFRPMFLLFIWSKINSIKQFKTLDAIRSLDVHTCPYHRWHSCEGVWRTKAAEEFREDGVTGTCWRYTNYWAFII